MSNEDVCQCGHDGDAGEDDNDDDWAGNQGNLFSFTSRCKKKKKDK